MLHGDGLQLLCGHCTKLARSARNQSVSDVTGLHMLLVDGVGWCQQVPEEVAETVVSLLAATVAGLVVVQLLERVVLDAQVRVGQFDAFLAVDRSEDIEAHRDQQRRHPERQ